MERYTDDVDPQRIVGTTIPHSSFGDPDCCGCLNGFVRGDQADIVCNECNVVIRTIPAAELQETFTKMELTLDLCSAVCPHCGAMNLFPGFSEMIAYSCDGCGASVHVERRS